MNDTRRVIRRVLMACGIFGCFGIGWKWLPVVGASDLMAAIVIGCGLGATALSCVLGAMGLDWKVTIVQPSEDRQP